jgi:hypothetical protein
MDVFAAIASLRRFQGSDNLKTFVLSSFSLKMLRWYALMLRSQSWTKYAAAAAAYEQAPHRERESAAERRLEPPSSTSPLL